MSVLPEGTARNGAKHWLLIAVASLIIAGLQSLMLVVGRLPGVANLLPDAQFFRRSLVVHVDLSLIVWFFAFLLALSFLLPATRRPSLSSRLGAGVAACGVLLFIAAAAVPGAAPVLSNYVPVIDHPLFVVGLSLFGLGAVLGVLDVRLLPGDRGLSFFPISAGPAAGIRAAVIALLLAALCFIASAISISRELPVASYYELVMWAGGHVLQFSSVTAMSAVWLMLLEGALGTPAVSYRVASRLYAVLITPLLLAPALALQGPQAHTTFTLLMRWGIFPVISVFIVLCVRSIWNAERQRRSGRSLWLDPRVMAFVASAFLTTAGFVLGALIRGSSTLIPAHYHASIGAVTVVYMAFSYRLLDRLAMPLPSAKLARVAAWQPLVFGAGQFVFAIGFGLAGAQGMARKTYGAEQHIRTLAEWIGLAVMGLGGLVAVVGGVTFLVLTTRAWLASTRSTSEDEGDTQWKTTHIQSRS